MTRVKGLNFAAQTQIIFTSYERKQDASGLCSIAQGVIFVFKFQMLF